LSCILSWALDEMASVSDVGGGVQCVGPRYDDALIGRVNTWEEEEE
jgi:hypothetical protein